MKQGSDSVPIAPVITPEGKTQAAVKTPDGGFSWRMVTLGLNDHKQFVEVKQGLKSGESVAIAPIPLLTEEQRQKLRSKPSLPR